MKVVFFYFFKRKFSFPIPESKLVFQEEKWSQDLKKNIQEIFKKWKHFFPQS